MLNKKIQFSKKMLNKTIEQIPTRCGYGDGLVWLGGRNKDVVVLTGDLKNSTKSEEFAKYYPERFIEVGVAEQNMMGVAAGLALSDKIPFVSSYAVFNPGRNWDQLRVSVAYSKANVKIAGAHSGISVGPDGATHQALEDIAITRVIPNMTIVVPVDYEETKKATIAAAQDIYGPVYLRFAREKTPSFTTRKSPFKIGQAEIFREGKDVAVIGAGPILYSALLAAKKIESEGIDVCVVNLHTIKPIDKKTIIRVAKQCRAVVTVEEHQIDGGVGSAVMELLAENFPVPVTRVGMPNRFGESGQPEELLKKYGMDTDDIIRAIKRVVKMI